MVNGRKKWEKLLTIQPPTNQPACIAQWIKNDGAFFLIWSSCITPLITITLEYVLPGLRSSADFSVYNFESERPNNKAAHVKEVEINKAPKLLANQFLCHSSARSPIKN